MEDRVLVEVNVSDWQPVLSGVPQGSVLKLLLFLVNVSDLHYNIDNHIKYLERLIVMITLGTCKMI